MSSRSGGVPTTTTTGAGEVLTSSGSSLSTNNNTVQPSAVVSAAAEGGAASSSPSAVRNALQPLLEAAKPITIQPKQEEEPQRPPIVQHSASKQRVPIVDDENTTELMEEKDGVETSGLLMSPMRIPRSCFSFDETQQFLLGKRILDRGSNSNSSSRRSAPSSQADSTQVSLGGASALLATTTLSWDMGSNSVVAVQRDTVAKISSSSLLGQPSPPLKKGKSSAIVKEPNMAAIAEKTMPSSNYASAFAKNPRYSSSSSPLLVNARDKTMNAAVTAVSGYTAATSSQQPSSQSLLGENRNTVVLETGHCDGHYYGSANQQQQQHHHSNRTNMAIATGRISFVHGGKPRVPMPTNDFSPLMPNPYSGMAEELKTPQRIEIEREDAIDILSCLVERGVSWHHPKSTTTTPAANAQQIKKPDLITNQNQPDGAADSTAQQQQQQQLLNTAETTDSAQTTPPITNTSKAITKGHPLVDPQHTRLLTTQPDNMIQGGESSISQIVQNLKGLACMEEDEEKRQANLSLIDELVKSHVYALEMSRAAHSACSWLKSIGRQQQDNTMDAGNNTEDDSEKKQDDTIEHCTQEHNKNKRRSHRNVQTTRSSSGSSPRSIDLLTTKARLHAAEDQLAGKSVQLQRLNEELAQCRAEIGRLMSEKQVAVAAAFQSPNRSILDESDDASNGGVEDEEDYGDGSKTDEEYGELGSGVPVAMDKNDQGDPNEGNEGLNNSFPSNPLFDDDKDSKMLAMYKKALEEANAEIGKLHSALHREKRRPGSTDDPEGDATIDLSENPPFVQVKEGLDLQQQEEQKKHRLSPGNKDEDTIHVHMLDSENFVTDWDELSPLPPPPDHSLRSPMVQTVLESWTEDEGLHESMLSWMDQVLANHADPQSIPPLTISNLDHQVKDGFVLHILPLLLRRKDILLNVKSRAHRRTTYDIAVSVDRPSLPGDFDMRRHLETIAARSDVGGPNSVTHSTSTALMGNSSARAFVMNAAAVGDGMDGSSVLDHHHHHHQQHATPLRQQHLMYDEMAEDMEEPVPNTGLMSALGGALGGFLNRNRGKITTPTTADELQAQLDHHHVMSSSSSSRTVPAQINQLTNHTQQQQPSTPAAELDEEQPYHRVVSAPSGRIGVTFVEFRGHAMVSDVAPDSPLQDWIFPSDILIAIDELPVSGMRVRDIIQVLKDRMDRQRALRIISCHAMNEIAILHNGSIHGSSSQGES